MRWARAGSRSQSSTPITAQLMMTSGLSLVTPSSTAALLLMSSAACLSANTSWKCCTSAVATSPPAPVMRARTCLLVSQLHSHNRFERRRIIEDQPFNDGQRQRAVGDQIVVELAEPERASLPIAVFAEET